MSNLPGDLSEDPLEDISATTLTMGSTNVDAETLEKSHHKHESTEDMDCVEKADSEEESHDEEKNYQGEKLRDLSGAEVLQFPGIKKEHWWQIWRPRNAPPPPKASLDDAEEIPLATASLLSKLTYWVGTDVRVAANDGTTDLWKLDASRESKLLSNKFIEALKKRQDAAATWNSNLASLSPPMRLRVFWTLYACFRWKLSSDYDAFGTSDTVQQRRATFEQEWRKRSGRKKGSVTWALNDVMTGFWAGGLFKVAGDTSQLMSPLLVKALINFSKEVYAANANGTPQPNIGRGIGLAIGLFFLTILASVCQHQFFFRSMSIGVLARSSLISAIFKRSLHLSISARTQHPNGKLMNHLSSDISRIDYCAQWFHAIWTAPIQLTITLILLLLQIGPSALAGFSLFILLAPLQTSFMQQSFKIRKKSMIWTDARSKLLQELLSSMQIIKVFTYEIPFLKRLREIRRKEMVGIRKILIIRAANQAIAFSLPTLASVLSFVTYASFHPNLDPALIFTSLAYFNLLRQPLMFLPRALSSLTDAQNAIERLTDVFEAEEMDDPNVINPALDVAIKVTSATFHWVATEAEVKSKAKSAKTKGGRGDAPKPRTSLDTLTEPFSVRNLNLTVPRGQLIGLVGPVGSGKSSILQGLIGEMQTASGSVEFGGRLGYCQQNAWIQNTTLRDNVLFGQPWNEHRYWQAIKDASLVADLEILPDGDLTEIGEKGINLSGGQKQRINIARALYFDADIILFDDPLSAVDAHVGKALFNDAILGLRNRGKTVVLVTHALHFLPWVDCIYTILQGHIVESGAYADLLKNKGPFSRLVAEFGGSAQEKEEHDAEEEDAIEAIGATAVKAPQTVRLTKKLMGKAAGTGKLEGRLMTSETRKTGTVGRKGYLHAGRARYTFPLTLLFATMMQGSQVMSTVWLTYWQEEKFAESINFYEGVYAALGISQAIFTFLMGAMMCILCYLSSNNLHYGAIQHVFYSPMSVFDTVPLGRIMSIFGKDIDTLDNQLADSLRMMAMTMISLIGSIIIITIYLHYFIVIICFVGIGYLLSGLPTIRAYGETARFTQENEYYMDLENRAYLLTCTNQRWLAIRLDFLGACLVFAVAVMAAKGGGGLTASQIALCLTYLTSTTQILGMVTRQTAEVENNNATLPQEPEHEIAATQPVESWPENGSISMNRVVMSYRKGLPPVLKGISMEIESGEKIGIVGRTGAGKTSLTVALFRLAELTSGSVLIDGVDISKIGLNALRSRIAIIPQDPVLFSGTLRSNLDPFKVYDDARLYDAMKRACILDESANEKAEGQGNTKRFTLDTVIEDEGLNLSVGERSLVSLARALVKDSKIVLLDEATAAVDMETDSKIQETIHREFKGKTLLCIAHRLRTIISWDRVLVMSAGEIEEFDTPLILYDQSGLFRSMCDRSEISREEIQKARAGKL
ncbi:hypothetical protein P7C73_g391, partial [Tremellales sp. Uapishka_1]